MYAETPHRDLQIKDATRREGHRTPRAKDVEAMLYCSRKRPYTMTETPGVYHAGSLIVLLAEAGF